METAEWNIELEKLTNLIHEINYEAANVMLLTGSSGGDDYYNNVGETMGNIYELVDKITEEAKLINNDALASGDDRDEILHAVDSLMETIDILSDSLHPKNADTQASMEVRYQSSFTYVI